MASPETRQINAINTAWASGSGAVTDIDEPIGSPDTAYYSGGVEDEAAEFGYTASEVVDANTVTNITFNMIYRDDGSAGTVSVQVDLLISGSPVGAGSAFSVTGSDAEYNVNIAAWNTDFTAAEMDAAELRITPTQSGMPGTQLPFLETANMVVTFTSATFTPDLKASRFYSDGTESGSSALAAQDTDIIVDMTAADLVCVSTKPAVLPVRVPMITRWRYRRTAVVMRRSRHRRRTSRPTLAVHYQTVRQRPTGQPRG
jgi:hypothetical protein